MDGQDFILLWNKSTSFMCKGHKFGEGSYKMCIRATRNHLLFSFSIQCPKAIFIVKFALVIGAEGEDEKSNKNIYIYKAPRAFYGQASAPPVARVKAKERCNDLAEPSHTRMKGKIRSVGCTTLWLYFFQISCRPAKHSLVNHL